MVYRRILLASLVLPALSGQVVQKPGLTVPSQYQDQKAAVQKLFTDSYSAYKKYAFGHDDLSPVSKSYSDGRNGWGASIADAMSTMQIMGLNDLFTEALDFVGKIDFSKSKTSDTVSVFETTIRYIGGFISAYELSGSKYPILIQKAKQIGDKLAYAWVGKNDMPYGFIDFTSNKPVVKTSNIAEAGTLTLEWSRLSKYTGNDTYRQLVEKSAKHIAQLNAPLPALAAQGVDPTSGGFVGGYVTWGGGSDSYFEYLLKYPRISNTPDQTFINTWRQAIDSSIKTLMRTSTVGNHLYLADYDSNKKIRHIGSNLECFHGGNWILGGKLLANTTIYNYGIQLADACWNTYASTATGIGPDVFYFNSTDGGYTGGNPPSAADIAFYNKNGFYPAVTYYILRPEVLETNMYAWRATGDTKYLDRAKSAVASLAKYVNTPTGAAGLNDVNNVNSSKIDDTESFWFAEVLKYLYLTFDDPAHISLDEYVFNTEAHPFKAPPAATYGSETLPEPHLVPFVVQSGELPEISPFDRSPRSLKSIINPQ